MKQRLILAAVFALGLGCMPLAQAAEQPAPKPAATVTPATPPAPPAAPAAPATTEQCEIAAPAGSSAQVDALQKQIDSLQQQVTQKQTLPAAPQIKDLAIRTKNLPSGNYRERCFACLTTADEDGERVLMCTCPISQTSFGRLSIALSMCAAGEEISYCSAMLVCGPCKISGDLNKALPKPVDNTNSGRIEQFLQKK